MRTQTKALSNFTMSHGVVVAGPLLWAVLILFHPNPGDAGPYEEIKDDVNRWLFVHVGQLVLTPLLFFAVWGLLDGLSSATATVSRAALVVWAVFFSAYDSIQGVATGSLIRHANGLAGDEQAAVARAIGFLVDESQLAGGVSAVWAVAAASWVTAAFAAAIALHRAGARKVVVAACCLSTVFVVHVAPAAIGLVALFVACILHRPRRAEWSDRAPAVLSS
jgi:hypothetical protein